MHTAVDRLKVLPGVIDVAAANMLPLAGEGGNTALRIAGTNVPLFERALGNIRTVNGDYFRTMGMSLQAGRLFSDADRERQVAVISTSIAKRAWPGEDPIGKRFHFGPPTAPDREIIGVINDVRGVSLEAGPSFSVYVPYWQGFFIGTSFAVKATADPLAVAPAVRRQSVVSMPSCPCLPCERWMRSSKVRSRSGGSRQISCSRLVWRRCCLRA